MVYTKEVLTLAVELGDAMLRNGAEIYRVEDTVIRILKAYEIEDFDVYVLSNGIFASANEGREDACSMVRHVPLGDTNLERISAMNQLARDITNKECALIDAWTRLEECKKIPVPKKHVRIICCGIGCGALCYVFGGKALDMVFAYVIGMLLQILSMCFDKQRMARFTKCLFNTLFVAALTILSTFSHLPVQFDKIMIAVIMPLLPGIAFTTSIRDFYNGDYLSGVIHLVDALLTALCIAAGVGIMISLYRWCGGVI